MNKDELINQIKQKEDIEKLVSQAIDDPAQIKVLIEIIETDKSSIKFGCEKILRLISEKKPKLIYPYFDFFVKLFDNENKFLKWGAIITISNLVAADTKNKFDTVFDHYFAPIKGRVMVTAANIIGNSWKIAKARPDLTDRIVDEILKVEKAKYEYKGELSPECKNIVCGDAADAFEKIMHQTNKKDEIIRFVKKQLKNTRPKVRKKAEKFIKLYV